MELRDLPRVHRSSFRPTRLGGRPVIVLDSASHWPALTRWRPDYLRTVVGGREIAVRETVGAARNVFQNLSTGGQVTFSEYLDWVLDTAGRLASVANRGAPVGEISHAVGEMGFERSYYMDATLAQLGPGLVVDAPTPDWFPHRTPIAVNFWCGVLGTSSGLHCDVTPNCNVQVSGRKHFILFSPAQWTRIYRVRGITHCKFDPNIPDFAQFPRARAAVGFAGTLDPGESIYIPAGWYHQVTVVSDWAVNVNFFWPRPFPQGVVQPCGVPEVGPSS